MAVFGKSLVDIPDDEGVHVKIAGTKGEKYVYKHVKYFRNSQGKPRNKSKAIGKFNEPTGRMYPNIKFSCLIMIRHGSISVQYIEVYKNS